MSSKEILLRLYNNYIKIHLVKIFGALILSVLVAGSTSSIAWLLDPAIKKIFIDKEKLIKKKLSSDNKTLVFLSNKGNIVSFGELAGDLFQPRKVLT